MVRLHFSRKKLGSFMDLPYLCAIKRNKPMHDYPDRMSPEQARAFGDAVLNIVSQIPRGRVTTYGHIAALAGWPSHSRMVGRTLRYTPGAESLPCHRVVNKEGRTAPGWSRQRPLLEEEGIHFKPNGHVDMAHHLWEPEEALLGVSSESGGSATRWTHGEAGRTKIIVAIDSFKGCLTSAEANQAACEGILAREPEAEVVQVPVSDGGEGFLEAFQAATGGMVVEVDVRDPLMRNIVAQYLVQGDTAVIEIAKASGLTLLSPEERNPMVATSYGTGQLVVDAIRRGCRHIIVGLGGSATSDCGIGMLRAIIDAFAKGGSWDDVRQLDDVHFTIATDVTNPLCGENGAAYVFGPQKGASHDDVLALDARAKRFAKASAKHLGRDCQNMPGAGAAGGLGYAFLQYMHAECRSGIDLLLDTIHFDELLQDTGLVITGEGSADCQTLMGKLPFGILQRCRGAARNPHNPNGHHVPVILIAGRIADEQQLLAAGFSSVACINPPGIPLEIALQPATAKENIRLAMASPRETFLPTLFGNLGKYS